MLAVRSQRPDRMYASANASANAAIWFCTVGGKMELVWKLKRKTKERKVHLWSRVAGAGAPRGSKVMDTEGRKGRS